jgi:acetyl-CoA/propionyl-CoA carboxylase biotin carboxyl carrier protein
VVGEYDVFLGPVVPEEGGTAKPGALGDLINGRLLAAALAEQVAAGDLVLVLEAMKMEQPISAHKAGRVRNLTVQAGAALGSGDAICEITG